MSHNQPNDPTSSQVPIDDLTVLYLAAELCAPATEAEDPTAQRRHYRLFGAHASPTVRGIYAAKFPKPFLAEVCLTQDQSSDVRRELAGSVHTHPKNLMHLAMDRSVGVRAVVAANPNTPVDGLIHLAEDNATGGARVRQAVAGNPSSPVEVLEYLSRDRVRSVVIAVVANPRASQDLILDVIARDDANQRLLGAILAATDDAFVRMVAHERASEMRLHREQVVEAHRLIEEELGLMEAEHAIDAQRQLKNREHHVEQHQEQPFDQELQQ
ncbi:hypothetical protein [Kocuria rosea]|uniref:hypothetical protein n=1 Tax=Kocuria rosea TaxID=1275 RepID=UPI0011AAD1B4|nr:hypothetical protein [Kocuria rosea]